MQLESGLPALADLHRHLDGSLRLETLVELAEKIGVEVPEDLWFFAGMGLEEALARFRTTLAVLQTPDAVCRAAAEICEDAEEEGVTTLEIRFAPQLHRGSSLDRIVDAALDGIGGRAGLLLCVLHGEPPGLVDRFVDLAQSRPGVVGIDLAGGPESSRSWSMRDYREVFERARGMGLGRTIHAGEGRPPEEIRMAVVELYAQRIGHGTTLLDDPRVVDLLLERQVVIEACPTSNLHTGAIPSLAAHPLPRWLELGVLACVNTDNTLLSAVTAPEEHRRVLTIPGMTETALRSCIEIGHRSAFHR